jgi:hypothetical protein
VRPLAEGDDGKFFLDHAARVVERVLPGDAPGAHMVSSPGAHPVIRALLKRGPKLSRDRMHGASGILLQPPSAVPRANGRCRTSGASGFQTAMDVMDVYFVGGFGVMGWVSAAEYYRGQPDPLADDAADIIQHMNTDHSEALMLLAHAFAGIESQEAAMTSVDRLGFQVRLKTPDGPRGARIAFSRGVSSSAEPRSVLTEMVAQARQP